MLVYAMDRDFYTLKRYEEAVNKPDQELTCFCNLHQLTEMAEQKAPDIVFLEGELTTLAETVAALRAGCPETKLIFVTENENLTPAQLNLQPDGWMAKPITERVVQKQIFHLRHPLLAKLTEKNQTVEKTKQKRN